MLQTITPTLTEVVQLKRTDDRKIHTNVNKSAGLRKMAESWKLFEKGRKCNYSEKLRKQFSSIMNISTDKND